MRTALRTANVGLAVGWLLVFTAVGQAQQAGDGDDRGSGDSMAIFLDALATASESIGLEATLADWTARETRVITQVRIGLMSADQGSAELYALGKAYMMDRRYDEAIRILRAAADMSPESYAAARALTLVGNIYYGNKVDAASSIRPLQEADRIYESLLANGGPKGPQAQQLLLAGRAAVLGRLGGAYNVERRHAEAIECYTKVVDSAELSRHANPDALVAYTQNLARLSFSRNDLEKARKYYARVGELVETSQVTLSTAIRYQLEGILRTWPKLDQEEAIAALEKLWRNPRYAADPAILEVGDELTWHYFFHEPSLKQQFEKTSQLWLTRARPHVQQQPHTLFSPLDAMFVRNILMSVESARLAGDTKRQDELIKEFERVYEGREVSFSVPAHREREKLLLLYQVYLSSMQRHVEEMHKLRQQRTPQPTPAP